MLPHIFLASPLRAMNMNVATSPKSALLINYKWGKKASRSENLGDQKQAMLKTGPGGNCLLGQDFSDWKSLTPWWSHHRWLHRSRAEREWPHRHLSLVQCYGGTVHMRGEIVSTCAFSENSDLVHFQFCGLFWHWRRSSEWPVCALILSGSGVRASIVNQAIHTHTCLSRLSN